MANAIDQTMVTNFLNATLPTATGGKPTVTYWTAGGLSTSGAMLLRLDSTAPTEAAAGTQLTGTGYTAGGSALAVSTPSSAGSAVTLPGGALSWTGSAWTIYGLDITDSANVRSWYGTFTGAPITVASGNTFQIAINAVNVSLT